MAAITNALMKGHSLQSL